MQHQQQPSHDWEFGHQESRNRKRHTLSSHPSQLFSHVGQRSRTLAAARTGVPVRLFGTTSTTNHQHTQKQQQRQQRITYLTDVEGDAAYLDRYVRLSRVLQFVPTKPRFLATTTKATTTGDDEDDQQPSSLYQGDFFSCRYFPYDHRIDFLEHESQTILIYGGDVWDKGGSDLYVIRQLLDLKRRYPGRVHFIMGNRDINKMRISQEMGLYHQYYCSGDDDDDDDTTTNKAATANDTGGETTEPAPPLLPHYDGVFWLRNFHLANGGVDPMDESILPPRTSAPDRLRWMLARTMGSPKAFELRRLELQREQQAAAAVVGANNNRDSGNPTKKEDDSFAVSDDEVVQSYRQCCHPCTGELGNYLANANLALRLGELLVVHGALPLTSPVLRRALADEASGKDVSHFWKDMAWAMPWIKQSTSNSRTSAKESIDSWIIALNEFAKESLDAWKKTYNGTDYCSPQDASKRPASQQIWALHGGYPPNLPAGQLIQYGMGWTPDGKRNPTVVYSSWVIDGIPKRFYPPEVGGHKAEDRMFVKLVQDFFRQSELRLILAGHQPQGDMPLPIRIDYDEKKDDRASTPKKDNFGWVLCCDTSYSGDTQWIDSSNSPQSDVRMNPGRGEGPGFRGDLAVSETLLEMDHAGQILNVCWHGVLSDGTAYESSSLPLTEDKEDIQKCNATNMKSGIGTLSQGNWVPTEDETPHQTRWWTKAHLDDRSTLVNTAKGYDVHNSVAQRPGRSGA